MKVKVEGVNTLYEIFYTNKGVYVECNKKDTVCFVPYSVTERKGFKGCIMWVALRFAFGNKKIFIESC